jgi:hypothetical protein
MYADEKYAEIGGAANAPKCECHDQLMQWNRDVRCEANGFWRCAVESRKNTMAYYWRDPIGQARRKEDERRRSRISRMEQELKELLNAT